MILFLSSKEINFFKDVFFFYSKYKIYVIFSAQSSSNDQQNQHASRWTSNDFEQFFRSLEIVDFGLFVPTTNNTDDIDMS